MDSSLLQKVGNVARASSGLFNKSRYQLSRLGSPSSVGLKRVIIAGPSLLLHLLSGEHKLHSSVGGFSTPIWAAHRNFGARSKRSKALLSSEADNDEEDDDIRVRFITDFTEDDDVYDDDEEEEVDEKTGRSSSLYAEVFDPFIHKSGFGQLLQYIDVLNENRALKESQGGGRGMTVKEDDETVCMWVNMPGLGKEDVKVYLEEDVLTMKGERTDDDVGRRLKYYKSLKIPSEVCKVNGIKAEMVNGVLKVVVPKFKEEERKDVIRFPVA